MVGHPAEVTMKDALGAVLDALRRVRARAAQLTKGEPQVPSLAALPFNWRQVANLLLTSPSERTN